MNESPSNPTPEQARRADYPSTSSTGAPTQPTGTIPPSFPPIPPVAQSTYSYPTPASTAPVSGKLRSRHMGMGGAALGPVFLIGVGVLFLLNNLGIVDWAIWGSLWRLWPLALVAVGLDMLFGRRKPWVSLVIAVGMLAAAAGLLLYGGFSSPGELRAYELNVPLADAKSADVEIDFGNGDLQVDSATSSASLMTGNLQYYSNSGTPRQKLNVDEGRAELTLDTTDAGFNFNFFGSAQPLKWDTHLNPTIPTSLKADLGTGNTTLDLSRTKLTKLEVDAGTGNATITFPQPTSEVKASIDGGVGNLILHIPAGIEATISVDSGIGNVDIDPSFTKFGDDTYVSSGYSSATNKLNLSIDAGVGNIKVTR